MASTPQLDQTDTILLLLAAETSNAKQRFRCDGITRLEKLVFLLKQETDFDNEVQEPFAFEAYHYGPYSREVYDAVDFLKAMQLMSERQVDVSSGLDVSEEVEALDPYDALGEDDRYIERQLELTEDGKAVAKVLSTRVSPSGKEALKKIKDKYGTMPLRQLLRYVYDRYPAYAENSLIRDAI
ncbi:MAG TPA: hypothetical protein VFB25_02090 [Gaiellaceae bacterium]|nr:hypothetical protein [Gaiellaceae bacterium]